MSGTQNKEGEIEDVLLTASNAMIQNLAGNQGTTGIPQEESDNEGQQNATKEDEEEEEAEQNSESQQSVHEPAEKEYYPNNRLDKGTANRSPRRPMTSPRSSRQPQNIEAKAEDPEGLAEEFENGATTSKADSQTLAQTVVELENRRDQVLTHGKFRDSIKIQMAIEKATIAQKESCKRETQKQALKENQEKQQKVKDEFREMQREMKEKEQELTRKNREYIASIQDRQKEERKQLDQKWKNQSTQRRYNRSSQRLRTLRLTQERLVSQKKFMESESISNIADRLEREETERNYKLMLADYRASVKTLQDKHQEELQMAEIINNRRMDEFKTFFELKKRPYLKRLNNLQKEEEDLSATPDNIWNRKHRNDGDLITSIVGQRTTKVSLSGTRNVNDYNTLKLPQLPIRSSATSVASNNRDASQASHDPEMEVVDEEENNAHEEDEEQSEAHEEDDDDN